ncbi:MAG: PadR family transcriptional regulator [Halobacteriota archaeon]
MDHRMYKNVWRDWAKSQKKWAKEQFVDLPLFAPSKRERGTLKYAALMVLQEQPLHGYAIIKAIEEKYGYPPSPGVVYPTLQMLEDQGYVVMSQQENKKVYTLTDEGQRCLEAHHDVVEHIDARARMPRWSSIPGISTQLREIVRTIFANYRYLDQDKVKKIEDVLEDARKRISEVIFEP